MKNIMKKLIFFDDKELNIKKYKPLNGLRYIIFLLITCCTTVATIKTDNSFIILTMFILELILYFIVSIKLNFSKRKNKNWCNLQNQYISYLVTIFIPTSMFLSYKIKGDLGYYWIFIIFLFVYNSLIKMLRRR